MPERLVTIRDTGARVPESESEPDPDYPGTLRLRKKPSTGSSLGDTSGVRKASDNVDVQRLRKEAAEGGITGAAARAQLTRMGLK
jgi:hypothetical protein